LNLPDAHASTQQKLCCPDRWTKSLRLAAVAKRGTDKGLTRRSMRTFLSLILVIVVLNNICITLLVE
jgi:hypothetical protein